MAKKILGVGLIILLGFVSVVAFRTLTFSSKQIEVDPIPVMDIDADAAAARLAKALTYKTISYQDPADFEEAQFAGLHRYLQQTFPNAHKALKKETVSKWSLLYTWEGSDPSLKPIILMAHLDVVPIDPATKNDWDHDPFGGVVADGFIQGRGALDDKNNALAIFEAIERYTTEGLQPKRTVYLSFGHDEEIGGLNGAIVAAELLQSRGVEAEFVLDEGGAIASGALPGLDKPVATIGVAEKGYISVEMTVRTEGGHSSQPPKETAIGIMSQAINRLENNQMPGGLDGLVVDMLEYLGPEMNASMKMVTANLWLFGPLVESQLGGTPIMNAFMRTTTAPTMFNAGVKENVLPVEVSAVVNFRILPGDTRDDVLDHIAAVVKDDRVVLNPFTEWSKEPSAVSPSSGPIFDLISRTISEVVPEAVVTPYLVVAGTDARSFEIVSDHVYRFSPMQIENSDLARIHGTNERIGVEAYATMIRFYHRLIENAAF